MQGKKEVSFSRTCITTQLAFLVPVYMTALTKTYVCISKTEVQGQGVPVSVCPSLCARLCVQSPGLFGFLSGHSALPHLQSRVVSVGDVSHYAPLLLSLSSQLSRTRPVVTESEVVPGAAQGLPSALSNDLV